MIYYTADLHLGHENIISYCNRPFENTDEMGEDIVSNWNSVVHENDDVYIIGDVLFKLKNDSPLYLDRMNGIKHLIVGNHDKRNLKKDIFKNLFTSIDDYLLIEDEGRKVVLFHYPIIEWDGYFRGAYHIYGHIHNSDNTTNKIMKTVPNAFNAGVDVNDFTPQTLSQLIARNKPIVAHCLDDVYKSEGYLDFNANTHYNQRAIIEYCKECGKEPIDLTLREIQQFIISDPT